MTLGERQSSVLRLAYLHDGCFPNIDPESPQSRRVRVELLAIGIRLQREIRLVVPNRPRSISLEDKIDDAVKECLVLRDDKRSLGQVFPELCGPPETLVGHDSHGFNRLRR